MRQQYLRDQRGVAMVLELVLVAAVLALAGLAVYQANHQAQTASVQTKHATSATEDLANSAASIAGADSTSDATVSDGADAMADEITASENDVTTLGGTSNASF
jgi:Tfp pilus assembly protein PilV